MTEMIERVARALARRVLMQTLQSGAVADVGSPAELAVAAVGALDDFWQEFVAEARVAVEAMAEATEDMAIEGGLTKTRGWIVNAEAAARKDIPAQYLGYESARDVWRIMVREALGAKQ